MKSCTDIIMIMETDFSNVISVPRIMLTVNELSVVAHGY